MQKMRYLIFLTLFTLSTCVFDFDDDFYDPKRETLLKSIPISIKRLYTEWSEKTKCVDRILRSTQATIKTKTFQWFIYKVRMPRRMSPVLEAQLLLEFYKTSNFSRVLNYDYGIELHSLDHKTETRFIISSEKYASGNVAELFFNITSIYQEKKKSNRNFIRLRFRFLRFPVDNKPPPIDQDEDEFTFRNIKAFLVTHEDNEDCQSSYREVNLQSRRVVKIAEQSSMLRAFHRPNLYPVDNSMHPCRLMDWFVSFHSIGWSSFIVAPSRVNARACTGICGFPMKVNSTEHAIVQTLVSIRNNRNTSASCVPVATKPTALLLYDDSDDSIYISTFPDMIANSCGCR
ncbi:protein DVR-1 isoform X1 [Parasteatoda tepidariorum]|uniref:protein DVR-1 isoform X1 n=2 Tax=Parasteatoda tepidariorum TaxID=114398 RepID=UPI001C72128B|nr:protein DVR-1 isoform X1 [Parasteatoda tepidariorum]